MWLIFNVFIKTSVLSTISFIVNTKLISFPTYFSNIIIWRRRNRWKLIIECTLETKRVPIAVAIVSHTHYGTFIFIYCDFIARRAWNTLVLTIIGCCQAFATRARWLECTKLLRRRHPNVWTFAQVARRRWRRWRWRSWGVYGLRISMDPMSTFQRALWHLRATTKTKWNLNNFRCE